ncbi:MAG: hypothetical protein H5T99_07815 [Moorella sp. (in: Bacteria)]|nr:hypothetical protein [Moorella sp. (in: firmicutes)]
MTGDREPHFTVFGSAVPVAAFTPGQQGYTSSGLVQVMDVALWLKAAAPTSPCVT